MSEISGSTELDNGQLCQLLRECASIIESTSANGIQNPTSSGLLFKAVEALHLYTEKLSAANNGVNSSPASTLTRPSFQRPTNKKSNLIANGWVEQQRRSKFRVVWKEVLASLVEARRPGEETTLWIQRESIDINSVGSSKGKKTLEALHQIPMKWLLDVKYLDIYGDFRFSIKVFNVPEDFVFRAVDEDSCKEWVATLKSAKDGGSINGSQHSSNSTAATEFPDLLGKKEQANGTETKNNHAVFPDLDMNSGLPKPSAPPMNVDNEVNGNSAHSSSNGNNQSASSSGHSSSSAQGASSPKKERLPIKELRAIAHAEGYDTRGMERSDLEKIAAYFAPVSVKNEMFQKQQQQQSRNTNGRASAYNTNSTTAAASGSNVDDKRIAAEVERIRKHQEEERMRREQEYLNQKQEEERRRNEELQKQTVAAKRREAEKVKQSQQRKQWQNQKQQQTNKNGPASKSYNFESSRFFDNSAGGVSGPRRKQPTPTSNTNDTHFAPQSNQTRVKQDPPAQRRYPQQQPQPQRTAFNQQRPAHNNSAAPPPHPQQKQNTAHGSPTNTNSQRSSDPTSPLNQKYAKVMANNQGDDSTGNDQATITTIKRNILITWALVPPQYNMLRTIDQLLTSIQTVFPPFSNVASHEYFAKWKIIKREELCLSSTMGNSPDEVKLKKAVRKLRVLLHPDRLPREFDAKQTFVCKMLWDVTNDAYEEFLKQKDDLDWIHK